MSKLKAALEKEKNRSQRRPGDLLVPPERGSSLMRSETTRKPSGGSVSKNIGISGSQVKDFRGDASLKVPSSSLDRTNTVNPNKLYTKGQKKSIDAQQKKINDLNKEVQKKVQQIKDSMLNSLAAQTKPLPKNKSPPPSKAPKNSNVDKLARLKSSAMPNISKFTQKSNPRQVENNAIEHQNTVNIQDLRKLKQKDNSPSLAVPAPANAWQRMESVGGQSMAPDTSDPNQFNQYISQVSSNNYGNSLFVQNPDINQFGHYVNPANKYIKLAGKQYKLEEILDEHEQEDWYQQQSGGSPEKVQKAENQEGGPTGTSHEFVDDLPPFGDDSQMKEIIIQDEVDFDKELLEEQTPLKSRSKSNYSMISKTPKDRSIINTSNSQMDRKSDQSLPAQSNPLTVKTKNSEIDDLDRVLGDIAAQRNVTLSEDKFVQNKENPMKPPTPAEDTHSAEDRFKKQQEDYAKVKTPRFRLSHKEGGASPPVPDGKTPPPEEEVIKSQLLSVEEEPEEKKEDKPHSDYNHQDWPTEDEQEKPALSYDNQLKKTDRSAVVVQDQAPLEGTPNTREHIPPHSVNQVDFDESGSSRAQDHSSDPEPSYDSGRNQRQHRRSHIGNDSVEHPIFSASSRSRSTRQQQVATRLNINKLTKLIRKDVEHINTIAISQSQLAEYSGPDWQLAKAMARSRMLFDIQKHMKHCSGRDNELKPETLVTGYQANALMDNSYFAKLKYSLFCDNDQFSFAGAGLTLYLNFIKWVALCFLIGSIILVLPYSISTEISFNSLESVIDPAFETQFLTRVTFYGLAHPGAFGGSTVKVENQTSSGQINQQQNSTPGSSDPSSGSQAPSTSQQSQQNSAGAGNQGGSSQGSGSTTNSPLTSGGGSANSGSVSAGGASASGGNPSSSDPLSSSSGSDPSASGSSSGTTTDPGTTPTTDPSTSGTSSSGGNSNRRQLLLKEDCQHGRSEEDCKVRRIALNSYVYMICFLAVFGLLFIHSGLYSAQFQSLVRLEEMSITPSDYCLTLKNIKLPARQVPSPFNINYFVRGYLQDKFGMDPSEIVYVLPCYDLQDYWLFRRRSDALKATIFKLRKREDMDMGDLEMRIEQVQVEKQYYERRMDLITSRLKKYINSISAQLIDPEDHFGLFEDPVEGEDAAGVVALKDKFRGMNLVPGAKNQAALSNENIDLNKLDEFLNLEEEEGLDQSNESQLYNLEGGTNSSELGGDLSRQHALFDQDNAAIEGLMQRKFTGDIFIVFNEQRAVQEIIRRQNGVWNRLRINLQILLYRLTCGRVPYPSMENFEHTDEPEGINYEHFRLRGMFIPTFRGLGLLLGLALSFLLQYFLLSCVKSELEDREISWVRAEWRPLFNSCVINALIVAMMSLINIVVAFSANRLAQFKTKELQQQNVMVYLIVIKFFNASGLMIALFGGETGDTVQSWFFKEGLAYNVIICLFFQAVVLPLIALVFPYLRIYKRKFMRARPNQKKIPQFKANKYCMGSKLKLELRVSDFVSMTLMAVFWSSLIPLALLIALIGCLFHYVVGKILITRLCQPQLYSSRQLTFICLDLLKWTFMGQMGFFFYVVNRIDGFYEIETTQMLYWFASLGLVALFTYFNKFRIIRGVLTRKLDDRLLSYSAAAEPRFTDIFATEFAHDYERDYPLTESVGIERRAIHVRQLKNPGGRKKRVPGTSLENELDITQNMESDHPEPLTREQLEEKAFLDLEEEIMRTHKEDLEKELQKHGEIGKSPSITGQLEQELKMIWSREQQQ